jgi:glucose/arabinose dehydrogenase
MKHTLIVLSIYFASLASGQTYQLTPAFPSLPTFSRALDLKHLPDGSNRLVLVQQLGLVYIFKNSPTVNTRSVFLDMRDRVSQNAGELGLLGIAFHPNFAENGYIYLNYTTTSGTTYKSFISRLQASGSNKDTVLRNSEKILLEISQPYSNHNGGWIEFGHDGYLYTSFGDGGSGGDPQNRAQNKSELLGKILRIDVNQGDPYSIPPTNPFASGGGRPEIFAYGLRNAWRCSFDKTTNKLWAGDVGQGSWEEVDTIINGGNYGWRVKEGYRCFNPSSGCDSTGFQSPLCAYPHPGAGSVFTGVSITGGYVYRGKNIPSLLGKYVFADYNGKVFTLTYDGLASAVMDSITRLPNSSISSFGVDQDDELYVVRYVDNGSQIYKFVPEASIAEMQVQEPKIEIDYNTKILTISDLGVEKYPVEIYDMLGRRVLEYKSSYNSNQYDLSGLLHGGYFITMRNSKMMFIKKIFL